MSLGPSPATQRAALLEQARIYLDDRLREPGSTVSPRDLQAQLRCGWNVACSLLEHLAQTGALTLVRGSSTTWTRALAPVPGSTLSLSFREHGALLRGLGRLLGPVESLHDSDVHPDIVLLRAIRARLRERDAQKET